MFHDYNDREKFFVACLAGLLVMLTGVLLTANWMFGELHKDIGSNYTEAVRLYNIGKATDSMVGLYAQKQNLSKDALIFQCSEPDNYVGVCFVRPKMLEGGYDLNMHMDFDKVE